MLNLLNECYKEVDGVKCRLGGYSEEIEELNTNLPFEKIGINKS